MSDEQSQLRVDHKSKGVPQRKSAVAIAVDGQHPQQRAFPGAVLLLGVIAFAGPLACSTKDDSTEGRPQVVGVASEPLTGTTNIKWVDTIGSLRGWNALSASAAILQGPDGGNGSRGVFTWSNVSASDDNATVVNPLDGGVGPGWRRISEGQLNVKWFGARGDGDLTRPGEQDAINAAISASLSVGANVFFPPGTYRLTSAIHADHDGLVLTGGPAAVLLVDPPAPGSLGNYPEGVLVNQNSGTTTTHRVVIEGLTFQVKGGSDNTQGSAAVIQLNNCADCIVRNVHVVRDPAVSQLPAGVDGVAMALGSTGGLIEGCTIDGVSKAGIYLPPNVVGSPNTSFTRVDTCEVKNTNGAVGATGIAVGSEHAVISNCQSHDNVGTGLLIQTIGNTPPRAPTDIQVIGGHYDLNHIHGIDITSAYAQVPSSLQISNVSTSYNWQNGIIVENAVNVVVSNPTVAFNLGAGMILGSSGASRVQVVNPTVFNNGKVSASLGLGIGSSADSITISGGRLYDDQSSPTQLFGIQLLTGGSPTNIRILDVDCMGANNVLQNAFEVTAPNGAEAASGRYRLEHAGSPTAAAFSAPPGSQYVDTSAGVTWVKTLGTSSGGWKQVVTQ